MEPLSPPPKFPSPLDFLPVARPRAPPPRCHQASAAAPPPPGPRSSSRLQQARRESAKPRVSKHTATTWSEVSFYTAASSSECRVVSSVSTHHKDRHERLLASARAATARSNVFSAAVGNSRVCCLHPFAEQVLPCRCCQVSGGAHCCPIWSNVHLLQCCLKEIELANPRSSARRQLQRRWRRHWRGGTRRLIGNMHHGLQSCCGQTGGPTFGDGHFGRVADGRHISPACEYTDSIMVIWPV